MIKTTVTDLGAVGMEDDRRVKTALEPLKVLLKKDLRRKVVPQHGSIRE